MFAELEEARPQILGYLFDAIAEGLRTIGTVKLNGMPRMADFARWAIVTEQALGAQQGEFMRAYGASQEEAVSQALEASPVAAPLWKFARLYKGSENAWEGTATDLLNELADKVDEEVRRTKGWPRAPHALSRGLKRLAPPLRDVGVYAEVLSRSGTKGSRGWRVFYSPPDETEDRASEASEASEDGHKPHKNGDSATDAFGNSSDATDGNSVSDSNSVSKSEKSVRGEKPANKGVTDATDATDASSQDSPEEDEDWGEL